MRKLGLLLLILFMFLLAGCSPQEPLSEEVSIYEDLYWSFNSMNFTDTVQNDILFDVGSTFEDFVILHNHILGGSLSVQESDAYTQLLTLMDEVVSKAHVNFFTVSSYSSSELRDACQTYSILLTIDDIVTFNSYKEFIETIKDSTYYISKIDYINLRLSRTLTTTEIQSLDFLQGFYTQLIASNPSVLLSEMTFQQLLVGLAVQLSYEPTVDEQARLEVAYDIIMLLIG